jgi:hypothetical protein
VTISLDVPMKVTPPMVHLRQKEAGKAAVGRFSVVVRPGLKAPLQASASPESLGVTLAPAPGSPRHWDGTVTWTPTEEATLGEGAIILRAGDESQRVTVRMVPPRPPRDTPPAPAPGTGSP